MSAPAMNDFSPAPVMTTTPTLSSVSISRQRREQLDPHLLVQRVELVGTVDGEDGDAAFAGDEHGLGHGLALGFRSQGLWLGAAGAASGSQRQVDLLLGHQGDAELFGDLNAVHSPRAGSAAARRPRRTGP